MPKYLIADFVIEIENKFEYLKQQCAEYECVTNALADVTVCVTADDIRRERLCSSDEYPDGYLESVCAYRQIALALPVRDALLLHSCVIDCEGRGIAFLARSGVGKTTHSLLWKKVFGDKVRFVNGDKPIVRFVNGAPFAYGTPWAGKEGLSTNSRVELTDLCFVERGEENSAELIGADEAIDLIMQQVLVPQSVEGAVATMELVDRLLSRCRLWRIKCNVSEDAARVAHDAIFKLISE